ncbi:MAG TPA: XRE family transcriptional regulator [Mycobacterium sp.]|nr:XRE family transcriptional regulator [Mycobacterium sp.]
MDNHELAALTHEGESSVIVSLSEAAMHMYTAAIDALPFPEDRRFHDRADVVLSGMRKLRAGLAEAASRNRSTASVIVALSDVRQRYDRLMFRAAAAPGAGLGQQLYATRIHARLSAQEVANGAGLRVDLIDDLEAGEIPTEEEAARVRGVIAALGGVPGTEHLEPAEPVVEPEPELAHEEHHEPAEAQGEEVFAGENAS